MPCVNDTFYTNISQSYKQQPSTSRSHRIFNSIFYNFKFKFYFLVIVYFTSDSISIAESFDQQPSTSRPVPDYWSSQMSSEMPFVSETGWQNMKLKSDVIVEKQRVLAYPGWLIYLFLFVVFCFMVLLITTMINVSCVCAWFSAE